MNENFRKNLLRWLGKLSGEDRLRFWNLSGVQVQSVKVNLWDKRQLSPIVCSVIEQMSFGQFQRQKMRPIDYQIIWPELSKKDNGGIDGCHAN